MPVVFAPERTTIDEWVAAPATHNGFVKDQKGDLAVRRADGAVVTGRVRDMQVNSDAVLTEPVLTERPDSVS